MCRNFLQSSSRSSPSTVHSCYAAMAHHTTNILCFVFVMVRCLSRTTPFTCCFRSVCWRGQHRRRRAPPMYCIVVTHFTPPPFVPDGRSARVSSCLSVFTFCSVPCSHALTYSFSFRRRIFVLKDGRTQQLHHLYYVPLQYARMINVNRTAGNAPAAHVEDDQLWIATTGRGALNDAPIR